MAAKKQKTSSDFIKILIATDKFKGSLTSGQAAENIAAGIKQGFKPDGPVLLFDTVEIADGGDGSAAVVRKYADQAGYGSCREVFCEAANPLGKIIRTSYLRYGETAFIEMARISGLELLLPQQRNPLETTTYGLGQVILHALENGVREVTLSIGGSATNDGGTGLLQALGFQFYEASGAELRTPYLCGKALEQIAAVKLPERILLNCKGEKASLKVICDVTNPLLGRNGATWVYGAQKGADPETQRRLEAGMARYAQAKVLHPDTGIADSAPLQSLARFATLPGSGAAGGVGFAATGYLGGELISGRHFFAALTRLEQRIASSDLVISGEGRIDCQSFQGKVIDGVAALAQKHQKPLFLFCGISELEPKKAIELRNTYLYTLHSLEPNQDRSMLLAGELLTRLAAQATAEHPELFHPPITDNLAGDMG